MPADIPPAIYEKVVCSIGAAAKYGVPANIILAVAQKEGGKPGQWVRNANSTYDVGPMQFNTAYIRTLARYGIGTADVEKAGCYSYDLAAWRLRGHIKNDRGDIWTRVANYHSRAPSHNATYRVGLMHYARQWGDWLSARFHTYDTLTVTTQTVATLDSAPVTVAPVMAATSTPNASPVRVAAARAKRANHGTGTAGGTNPYSAPISVAFTPPRYVPRTIAAVE